MIIDKTQPLWFKRYLPQKVEDVVLPKQIKEKIQSYVDAQSIPHLGFFSSIPGTGKSSLAHAIIKEIDGEALWINASLDSGKGILQSKITKFASSVSFDDKIKIVVMDEFDGFSAEGQKGFRGFIDEFSDNCVFIFTGNFSQKIISPMLDRMEVYDFNSFSKEEMVKPILMRLMLILDEEKITYDPKDLIPIINTFYPSIRSMVGALQRFSINGKLIVDETKLDGVTAFDVIMNNLLNKNFDEVIKGVNDTNAPDNMYSFLYKNMSSFNKSKQAQILLVIAKYQHMSNTVRDKNLNLSACLAEIMLHI